MRVLFVAVAVVGLALPVGVGAQQRKNTAHLDGHWLCVRVEYHSGANFKDVGWTLIIAGDKVSWKTKEGGSSGPHPLVVDPEATPPRMDITGEGGIYRFDADTLVIALWSGVQNRQATFELAKQNPPGRVLTFRRVRE